METTTLDDRSPNITYGGGGWNVGGVPGEEFDGTTTWTTTNGSTATIHFLGQYAKHNFNAIRRSPEYYARIKARRSVYSAQSRHPLLLGPRQMCLTP